MRKAIHASSFKKIGKLYLKGYSCKDVSDIYLVDPGTINRVLKKIGVPLRDSLVAASNRNKNKGVFHNSFSKVESESQAYWIGFLLADGCVYKNEKIKSQKQINLTLKRSDEYMIENFIKFTGATGKIRRTRNESSITVCSDKICDDLSKYSIVPRKSHRIELPNLPIELMPHLIRGYFDGDGHVSHNGKYGIVVGFSSGSLVFLRSLQKFFKSRDILSGKITNYETYGVLSIYKKDMILKFFDMVYKDAGIYLRRKKIRFVSLIRKQKSYVIR